MPQIIENLNVDITCRSCLAECDALSSLYSEAETLNATVSLGEILQNLFQIKWNQSLKLPSKMCNSCQQELFTAYNFKIKIEESESALLDYLCRNELMQSEDTKENEISIEEEYNFLKIKDEKHDENYFEENFNPEPPPVDNLQNDKQFLNNEEIDEINYIETEQYGDEKCCDNEKNILNKQSKKDVIIVSKRKVGNFNCNECSSIFATQSQLDNHIKIHKKGPIKFYCETCDKCFATNRNLERHRKLHNKIQKEPSKKIIISTTTKTTTSPKLTPKTCFERNYSCTNCSAKFSCSSQLECHMKAHSGKNFHCETCDRFFVNNRNLQRHLKLHFNQKENQFKCSKCEKSFQTNIKLKLHERNNCKVVTEINGIDLDTHNCMPHETKLLECKICNLKYDKIYLLRQHLLEHSQVETIDPVFVENSYYLKSLMPDNNQDIEKIIEFISEEVRNGRLQKFFSGTNMVGNELHFSDSETEIDENEEKTLIPSRLYTCENCYETFDRRYKILNHQRNCHPLEEYKYHCDSCGMKYVGQDLLDYHKKTQCYNDEKQYTCDVCQMKFMWKSNIEQHITIHHSKSRTPQKIIRKYTSKRKLDCEICHKKFSRPEHLERHLRTHNPAEKKFECPTCKKKFSRKDNLRCHMKVHDEKRTDIGDEGKHFLCVFCGRKFRNSSNLVVHTRRHTGEKPFKCDFCDKGFPRSSDLRTHRRTHTGEKPHLCNTCGKGFSRSNKLTRHMRIHTGDRPYKCTYCDRAFTQSNDLTIHIRRHTGEKPYTCGICGERFIQGTALQTHRKTRGHYEDVEGVEVPFAYLSQNNPNPLNNAGRVDQIGIPKINSLKNNAQNSNGNEDIKPMKNEVIDDENISSTKEKCSNISNNFFQQQIMERNSDTDIGSSTSFNYKDISSFVTSTQPHLPYAQLACNPLALPLLQGVSGIHNSSHNGNTSASFSILGSATSPYNNDSN